MVLNVLFKDVCLKSSNEILLFLLFNFEFFLFSFIVPVYGMFPPGGIFIWWPKIEHVDVSSYLIQFQSNEPTDFSDHVIGTTKIIDEFQTWTDITSHLTKVAATTNIYPQNDDSTDQIKSSSNENPKSITQLSVNGNVTGILIPNTKEIVVRVLVPVFDEDGELIQDMRYVEWKKVNLKLFYLSKLLILMEKMFHFLQIYDIPGRSSKFKLYNIGAHHVVFESTDQDLSCVRICYRETERICDDR